MFLVYLDPTSWSLMEMAVPFGAAIGAAPVQVGAATAALKRGNYFF